MLALGVYEKCKQYIKLHSKEPESKTEIFPCITFSRQTGAGSYQVSEHLINILQKTTKDPQNPWTYFNKELISKVLEDLKLPKNFSNYLSEKKYNHISDAVNDLLGVKPSEWNILHKTTEIILRLAEYGKVIIVGRGSSVITSKLNNCFHIRLVAPIEYRIDHIKEVFKYSRAKAEEYVKKSDIERKKYLKSHFFRDPDDATLYHLVLNTGKLSYEEAAATIAESVICKFPKSFNG